MRFVKKIWNLYVHDMKQIATNWVAAVLVGGLLLLPSLYAWVNIEASIDPYANTRNIKVGIVNEDKGAKIQGHAFNAGKEIVRALRNNHDLGWKFVGKQEGMKNVRNGDYFATIVIPSDFSEKLATIVQDRPEQAVIHYYENDKKNAIAPRITSKGASTITEQVSDQFVAVVNSVLFSIFHEAGVALEQQLPDIRYFETLIFQLQTKLPEIKRLLNQSMSNAKEAERLVNKAEKTLPEAKRIVNSGIAFLDEMNQFFTKAEAKAKTLTPQITENLRTLQQIAMSIYAVTNKLQENLSLAQQRQWLSDVQSMAAAGEQMADEAQTQLRIFNNMIEKRAFSRTASANMEQLSGRLTGIKSNLREAQRLAKLAYEQSENGAQLGNHLLTDLNERAAAAVKQVDRVMNEYEQHIAPLMKEKMNETKQTLQDARRILADIANTILELERFLQHAGSGLKQGEEMLQTASDQYPFLARKVNDIASFLVKLKKETNIYDIIRLLKNDPRAKGEFLAHPVDLKTHRLFPLPNYGSGMNPFYTVLSIWVGCLLLVSLLSTEPYEAEGYTSREIYFGRLLTFWTCNSIQALIVTLGDVFLLKNIYIHDSGWFILFGLLCSFVFIVIVFTLVSVFSDVGKALAIVLLVFQIAGAGGTYPVQLIPKFFQNINPFLPFTYAIDLMREAVGGIVWGKVKNDAVRLMMFAVLALLLGTLLKEPLNKYMHSLHAKAKKSGLFH